MQQQITSPVKFSSKLEIHPMIIKPSPIRVRSMPIPLPDDPLSKHLEGIKISETK
jgi:hypothetical protein